MEKYSVEEKIEEVLDEMRENGIGCGIKIANIVKTIHPDALTIVPLYRSCIVVMQSDDEKKAGTCTIHAYADPHWRGQEIDFDTLKNGDFHFQFQVEGDRQGPIIIKKEIGVEDNNCKYKCENDEPRVLEYDEN